MMELFSPAATVLTLSFVFGHHNSLTDGDTALETSLKNKVNIVLLKEAFQKRDETKPPLCGRTKVIIAPISRGKKISKDDEDGLYGDVDDDEYLDKIFGGTYVTYGEIPWQVGVLFQNNLICSGAIISEFWVTSAAHCFRGQQSRSYKIAVGDHRVGYQDLHEVTYEVNTIISHKEFSTESFDNDIALVKIKAKSDGRGIRFNDYVQPICIPYSSEVPPVGVEVTSTGWGKTTADGGGSAILKKTKLVIIGNDVCNSVYENINTSRTFCVFNLNFDSELCAGDSGGPAAYLNGAFAALIGVSAYSSSCGEPILPSGLSSIPAHRDWIDTTIRLNSIGSEGILPVRRYGSG